jgi:fatty acid synthase
MLFVMYTANGYVRSEAICAMFLQRARDAKRIYATVLNVKSMSDGYKDEGISYPSGDMHSLLLKNCYKECRAESRMLEFLEAHGTGTKVSSIESQTRTFLSKPTH